MTWTLIPLFASPTPSAPCITWILTVAPRHIPYSLPVPMQPDAPSLIALLVGGLVLALVCAATWAVENSTSKPQNRE